MEDCDGQKRNVQVSCESHGQGLLCLWACLSPGVRRIAGFWKRLWIE